MTGVRSFGLQLIYANFPRISPPPPASAGGKHFVEVSRDVTWLRVTPTRRDVTDARNRKKASDADHVDATDVSRSTPTDSICTSFRAKSAGWLVKRMSRQFDPICINVSVNLSGKDSDFDFKILHKIITKHVTFFLNFL